MSTSKIPGLVRPLDHYRAWKKNPDRKSTAEKREVVIRGIERALRGEPKAPSLERFDYEQKAPVIRVLYASTPLPIFDGKESAVIDPACDRQKLWGAIIGLIRSGAYDAEIEAVARRLREGLERNRKKALHEAA